MQRRTTGREPATTPAEPDSRARPLYPIDSVDNALRLILLFGEQPQLRLTEASQHLGVATSTAHRLLAMLQYRGFVNQDLITKAYRPGPSLTSIAFAVLRRDDVRNRLRPLLVDLHSGLEETVHLGVLEGSSVRFIDAIESPKAVRVSSRVGRSLPAHCTSTGRALLACLPREELRRRYPRETLEQMTPRCIGHRDVLERELRKVRNEGVASAQEETEEGVSSMAVAVPMIELDCTVAVNVSVPTSRMTPEKSRLIRESLQAAVCGLSRPVA